MLWLSKQPDPELRRRAWEEASARTPGGVDRLLRDYDGRPDDQKRVLYRALSLHGDHRCRPDDTVDSLRARLDTLESPPDDDDSVPPADEQVAGADGYTGTREQLWAHRWAEGIDAMNPGTTTGAVLASVAAVRTGGDLRAMREAGARGAMVEGFGGGTAVVTEASRRGPPEVPLLPNGLKLDEAARRYGAAVASNRPWSWEAAFPDGRWLTKSQRSSVSRRAFEMGLVKIPLKPGTRYADFAAAGLVGRVDYLPRSLWKASDADQFDWLDARIPGGRPPGTTWHHSELTARMELVPCGIHRITSHVGGRFPGHWAHTTQRTGGDDAPIPTW